MGLGSRHSLFQPSPYFSQEVAAFIVNTSMFRTPAVNDDRFITSFLDFITVMVSHPSYSR